MPEHKLTDAEERMLWEEAARKLSMIDLEPPITMKRVDQVLDQLPSPRLGGSLDERIRRASHQQIGSVEPFVVIQLDALGDGCMLLEDTLEIRKQLLRFSIGKTSGCAGERFTPITEVFRMAAADSGKDTELPDPDRALESDDGRFRIRLIPKQGKIEVTVQALGFAADEHANERIGLCAPSVDEADAPDPD